MSEEHGFESQFTEDQRDPDGHVLRAFLVACHEADVSVGNMSRYLGIEERAVAYQDTPNSGKKCSMCVHFVSGTVDTGNCKIVAGSISPLGWCRAWTAK